MRDYYLIINENLIARQVNSAASDYLLRFIRSDIMIYIL